MRLKIDNRFHGLEVAMRQVQADIKDIKMMTGKETQNRLDAMNIDILHNKHAILKLENERESKLKVLDQSIFNGLDAKWRFAAVNKVGRLMLSPSLMVSDEKYWYCQFAGDLYGKDSGYDATDWQNSLIERENLAAELLEIDLELPSVCETCGK